MRFSLPEIPDESEMIAFKLKMELEKFLTELKTEITDFYNERISAVIVDDMNGGYSFYLTFSKSNDFAYKLFEVSPSNNDIFPLTIYAYTPNLFFDVAKDLIQFEEVLQKLFQTERTSEIINNLI